MKPSVKHNGGLLPLSIKAHGLLFIFVITIAFSSIGIYAYQQLLHIDQQTIKRNNSLADREIHNFLKKIKENLNEVALELEQWDELKQQFIDPTYYVYWHSRRLPNASFLPSHFDTLELYDSMGIALSKNLPEHMPKIIDEDMLGSYVIKSSGYEHVLDIRKIHNTDGNYSGYAAIEYDLSGFIYNLYKLRYVDITTITLNANVIKIPLDELINNINYNTLQNPEFRDLQQLLIDTMKNLAIVSIILTVAFWYLLMSVAGHPLRQLARHIDNLSVGEYANLGRERSKALTIREYETVRQSFNDYQIQLFKSETALKFSESRLQAVLYNIPDGIITFDELGIIDSVNTAFEKIFHYNKKDILGEKVDLLFDDISRQAYYHLIEKLVQKNNLDITGTSAIELTGKRKDGETFDLEIVIREVDFAGKKLFIGVIRDISDVRKSKDKLQYLANYDSLTGLPNRILFHDRLKHAIQKAHRNSDRVGLLFIDLDRFKYINDTLGHHIGDQLLQDAATRIRECIREGDTVARLGGDEFTVINEGINSIKKSEQVAQRIIEVLRKPFMLEGREIFISASIGITIYPDDALRIDELIKHADAAMYCSKSLGGDTYQLFTQELSHYANQRLDTENKLRQALENDEFEIYYQPRINIRSGKAVGMEALLRWNRNDVITNNPSDFIPILEDTGMIINIGNWVITKVCEHYKSWLALGTSPLRMAINLSTRQFKHDRLLTEIDNILEQAQIPFETIEFEITEGLLIDDIDSTSILLNALHQRGIHISVDDFGTGYSSLSYLKSFPIDTLKIDQSFVRDVIADQNDAAIIETIIAMAKNLGMRITAEGVETTEQLEFLRSRGCDEAQGYLFGKPMPADQVINWIEYYEQNQIVDIS